MLDINDSWKLVLEDIKGIINMPTFKTWFENIYPVSFKKNCLTISVNSHFAKEWLETRYVEILSNSIKKNINKDCVFKIIVSPGEELVYSDSDLMPPNKPKQKKTKAVTSRFNHKYTFDTFVIGSGNRFSHAAAQAVSENPGKAYNPLFIYGGVGLGKTHLLHAIGQYIIQLYPDLTVTYVSAEKFLNDFINALRDKTVLTFKEHYRNTDVLLVDDIQFLEEKEASQEEFFHTFNALHDTNRQIVLSSDRKPKDISTLEERLRSRFEWGLVTDIQPPDFETRFAILRKYSEREKIVVSDDILSLIASKISSNIRELEGALTRVVAYASLTKSKPDLEAAKNVLKDILPDNISQKITIQQIIKEVSNHFSIPINTLTGSKRSKFVSQARQLAMYLSRELTSNSLPKIGNAFGNRDHATVIYAISKISDLMNKDESVYKHIQQITNNIKNKP
ncbi:MAG: chromosomal replication initiator protein DnaA [Actinomycetota bacterium]|jgi:chromosomal replication initiator protein|nr:chromosomal replication initiator protein DnaA [Actinomycetota bacterium]